DKLKHRIYLPPLPKKDTIDQLVYKNRLANFLRENNFPRATTYALDIDTVNIDERLFPYLLKPVRGSSGLNIKKIDSQNELAENLLRVNAKNYILQEMIPGMSFSCSLLASDGKILAETIQESLASRGFGFSTAIRFVKNERISDL